MFRRWENSFSKKTKNKNKIEKPAMKMNDSQKVRRSAHAECPRGDNGCPVSCEKQFGVVPP